MKLPQNSLFAILLRARWWVSLGAAAIAFAYIIFSGVRSPANISILKDILLFGAIVIVGVAAAIANAVFHATGRRVRICPSPLDKLL